MPNIFLFPDWLFIITIIVIWLVLSVLVISWYEPRLIYYPRYPSRELARSPQNFENRYRELWIPTADGPRIHGWFISCSGTSEKTLLFLHGNAGNISHRLEKCHVFLKLGLNVLIIDYRGYGQSEGKPTEKGTYLDADAAYGYLGEELHLNPGQIVVYGESLGTAVAVDLVSRMPCGGLILEAPFTSIADVAKRMFRGLPIGLLARHRYDSLRKIRSIDVPLLLLHSRQDELFPLNYAERLLEAAQGPKRLVELRGSHSDAFFVSLPEVNVAIEEFLRTLN